ncbi:MAG: TonB-dependent receptor [Chitinophagaceae bacterium]
MIARSQTTITGKITDDKGNPLEGSSVYIKGNGGTVADAAGNYKITVSATQVTITVTAAGYKPGIKTMAVSGTSITIDFVLAEDITGLSAVVVTATNSPRRTQQAMPLSITTYNETKLARVKFNSTADMLRGVPGIAAEGGGGEVASNIFVRGLPSGGQYQFTPLQIDGMPVVSTMGLTSSAPDVFFRNDLSTSRLDFVRGGSATLYGAGSVAGIINYTSKTGTDVQRTQIETEYSSPGKVKLDFNTGGPLAEKLYYNITGTYRYDYGPIRTGIPTTGYQLRGNIRKVTEKGSFTLYAQYINDQVQFYSPYHLTADKELPTGWDGKKIWTMETGDVADLAVKTPNGFYQSHGGSAASTKGGYIMADFVHNFSETLRLNVKARSANYKHEFNFFNTDGNGRNPLSQATFLTTVVPTGTAPVYTYANDNTALPGNALVLENTIIDRNRPLNEIAGQANLTKVFQGKSSKHTVNIGTFMSHTNAIDFNFQLRYLSEYKNIPRIVNLRYTNAANVSTNYTTNGIVSAPGYTNRDLTSNRLAGFLTDEISIGKLNIDAGIRVENHTGNIIAEKSATAANADGRNVAWGTGAFDRFKLNASDWAAAIGISYAVQPTLNVYGNFSRGYFFPEYRGYTVKYNSQTGAPTYPVEKPEHIIQGEAGAKYNSSRLTATVALYYVSLKDRYATNLLSINGVVTETQSIQSSRSYGVEATWDYNFAGAFHLAGTGTYQKAIYTDYIDASVTPSIDNKDKWLERQPRLMLSPALYFDNRKLYAAFSADYVGKRYANAANLVQLDPYTLARADVAYTFKIAADQSFRVGVGVFNLFNEKAVTEGNPRAGNTQTNTGDFFVGRISLPRAIYARMALTF